jgi:hypothetical protein
MSMHIPSTPSTHRPFSLLVIAASHVHHGPGTREHTSKIVEQWEHHEVIEADLGEDGGD